MRMSDWSSDLCSSDLELLHTCLSAVIGQSVPCDYIVVVDNASIDGTAQVLSHARYQDVQVCRLHNNTGASGGFSLGFQLGYATGADFIWAMDDDVIPDQNALLKLLDARSCLRSEEHTSELQSLMRISYAVFC